jgi:hypothetical protein
MNNSENGAEKASSKPRNSLGNNAVSPKPETENSSIEKPSFPVSVRDDLSENGNGKTKPRNSLGNNAVSPKPENASIEKLSFPVSVRDDLPRTMNGYTDPERVKFKADQIRTGTALNVDPARKYQYLEDEEFEKIFGISMSQFEKLNEFKRHQMLRKENLL